jgi:hypothetical protein
MDKKKKQADTCLSFVKPWYEVYKRQNDGYVLSGAFAGERG